MRRETKNYNYTTNPSIYLETLVKNKNRPSLLIIPAVALLILSIPFIVLCSVIDDSEGLPFAFVAAFIISAVIAAYLLRLFLWNKYGKEVFIIKDNVFISYYDYKLFRKHFQEIEFNTINIYFIYNQKYRRTSDFWYAAISEEKMNQLLHSKSTISFELDSSPHIIASQREIPISVITDIGRALDIKQFYKE